MVPDFFADRRPGSPGLALYLTAGDPPWQALEEAVLMLDDLGVDCLELGVPFPNSPTDGPVIRRSAERALAAGTDLRATLRFVSSVRPSLTRLRIVVLADWSETIRPLGADEFARQVAGSGADGVLVHAVPPRSHQAAHAAALAAGLPWVSTCYATSKATVVEDAAARATAYTYVVAHQGRSGSAPSEGYHDLAAVVGRLHQRSSAPVAVGFGVRRARDLRSIQAIGADAAVVGSAAVACVEQAVAHGHSVASELKDFLQELQGEENDGGSQ